MKKAPAGLRSMNRTERVGVHQEPVRIYRARHHNPKAYRCAQCTAAGFRIGVGIAAVIALIPIIVLVILTYLNSKNLVQSDWCPVVTGQEMLDLEGPGSGGVAGQIAKTHISMNGNELKITWNVLKQLGNISVANSLQICGPLSSAQPVVSSTCTSLCGPPTLLVCEGVDPGEFSGERTALDTGSGPVISPEPFIRAVRRNPDLYYVLLNAANGILRSPLAVGCASGT